MVFINLPTNTTYEEETLLKKYEKLEKKRKQLEQAAKPKETKLELQTSSVPVQAIDARLVIEKLKQKGALPQIFNTGKKSEFKRKFKQKFSDKKMRTETNYEDALDNEEI